MDFRRRGVVHQRAFQIVGEIAYAVLPVEDQRRWVYEAMKLAVPKELLHEPDDVACEGSGLGSHFVPCTIPNQIFPRRFWISLNI